MTQPTSGGVEPPSLSEVMEIVRRRQRHRQRIGLGAAVAALVVGSGVGLSSLRGHASDRTTLASTPTVAEEPQTTTSADNSGSTSCAAAGLAGAARSLLDSGVAAFVGRAQPAEIERALSLASEWTMPADEVKALAGLSFDGATQLDESTLDLAIERWGLSGHSAEELGALAREWHVSTGTVKVLAFLDTDRINGVVGPCLR